MLDDLPREVVYRIDYVALASKLRETGVMTVAAADLPKYCYVLNKNGMDVSISKRIALVNGEATLVAEIKVRK